MGRPRDQTRGDPRRAVVEPQATDDDPSPDSDAALVRAAQRGELEAFAALYHRYHRVVHAVVLARTPAQEALDLVQEVFLRALRQLASLRDPAAFGGWLVVMARNCSADFLRRKRATEPLPEALGGQRAPTAEAEHVLRTIRGLPEAYRETLMMRLVEGFTGPEIAQATGLTPRSVRVNLHRGMRLLRERLGVSEKTS